MKTRSLLPIVLASALLLGGCAGGPSPRGEATAAAGACGHAAHPLGSQSCSPFTRRYSARQLSQTGHMNPARALATLDPAVTTQGP
jgi:hypothetical protein